MLNNERILRLAEAALYQNRDDSPSAPQTPNVPFYICAPAADTFRLRQVLRKHQIPHLIHVAQQPLPPHVACVYFYHHRALAEEQVHFLAQMAAQGIPVINLVEHLERYYQRVMVEWLDDDYLADSQLQQRALQCQGGLLKRAVDVVFAGLGILFSLPVWLLVGIAIKLDSPGPVFFCQRRTGLFDREFSIIKFRSMRTDAEKQGAQWAAKSDCRITRVGRFLRKTRLDELPQLINVLRGEMSWIGPRPEREVFIRDLERHVPFYRLRHQVKPGVTGLAQVRYGYGASVEDALHKHRYDLYYIKHRNLWLDFGILLQTVRIVLTGQGV